MLGSTRPPSQVRCKSAGCADAAFGIACEIVVLNPQSESHACSSCALLSLATGISLAGSHFIGSLFTNP